MKNKHLTLEDRIEIYNMLQNSENFTTIARVLGKDRSTISKEVKKHSVHEKCTQQTYIAIGELKGADCPLLRKAPHVCNGCRKRYKCGYDKVYYRANTAHKEYLDELSESRKHVALNRKSFYEMDKIIREGIDKGQHLYQIYVSNDFDVSLPTIYRYIKLGYMSITPLDTPRMVKFKERPKPRLPYIPNGIRVGRTLEDFTKFMDKNAISNYLEMDLVIGRPGGKVIMTWNFTFCNFMVAFLLDSKEAVNVANTFVDVRNRFADEQLSFKDLIPVILTDNGSEFSSVNAIENDLNGQQETKLFFCRPMMASDKARIEKNHTLFRDICPKGTSFDDFTQDDVNLIFSHVNSTARKVLAGKTPYEVFRFTYGERITSIFGIQHIPLEEVIQSPKLIKTF